MTTQNRYFSLFFLSALFFSSFSEKIQASITAQELNKMCEEKGVESHFATFDGYPVWNNKKGSFPVFAEQTFFESLFEGGGKMFDECGNGGISPFSVYSEEELLKLSFYRFYLGKEGKTEWVERLKSTDKISGALCHSALKRFFGSDYIKNYRDFERRQDATAELLNKWTVQLFGALRQNIDAKIVGIFSMVIFVFLGLPITLWNVTKYASKIIFVPRPKVLRDKDSNIYGGWLKNLFFSREKLPKVIVNKDLADDLAEITSQNWQVSADNKAGKKVPYPNLLIYGDSGVGKTLFVKTLAEESDMNFFYLSAADLVQLDEETCLQTFFQFLRLANRKKPCMLIIDEADQFFSKKSTKHQMLGAAFQKEFDKAAGMGVQFCLLTNFPGAIPDAIISRTSHQIHFRAPNRATQIKLFDLHLGIALDARKISISKEVLQKSLNSLPNALLEGLTGRDIEKIALSFALGKSHTAKALKIACQKYKNRQKKLKEFVPMGGEKEIAKTPSTEVLEEKETKERKKLYPNN